MPTGSSEVPVRVLSRRLVKASDPSLQPHVVTFSNLDLYPDNVQASIVCLYPKLPKSSPGGFYAVVSTFEDVLPTLLSHFFPLAGRIVINPSSGVPELHCHNQGAELVVGEVGVALGSLDYGLAEESLKKIVLPYPEDVTLSVQLLSFACGAFSVVWANNNLLNDGNAITMCVRMWSELARTGGSIATVEAGAVSVNHDRSVFRPRDPPAYSDALDAMFDTYDDHRTVNALTAAASFLERLYYVEASDIAKLRDMATVTELQRPSRVQAVSAYLWKVLAAVVAASRVPEERCCMGWMVDARRRVKSPELVPAMRNYFGNVTAYALFQHLGGAVVEEIRRKPLAEVAAMVREIITSIDYDEYLQELVDVGSRYPWLENLKPNKKSRASHIWRGTPMLDWVEVHKTEHVMEKGVLGMGSPTLNQTVFASFPLDTDFGFGDAALALPMCDYGRLCSGYLSVGARPGEDGSWLLSAYIWPQLAAALESDGIFKPLMAEYLGLTP
ncbi:omega-hydroxypalmitate O-feruloyl transferase-like [Miscanthus floridulus]|uniref:omega-hydroxypalmitate O-feruloyl transferase-like n=1 Tax=Miscanthus floridulus TaxID=154761 RepID=UPI00345942E9